MKAQLFWTVGIAALVAACDTDLGGKDNETGGGETGETDTDNVTPEALAWADSVDLASFVSCDGGTVTFSAETTRWGGDVELYLSQTAYFGDARGWDENHTMEEVDHSSSEDGYSKYERTLTTGATLDDQTEDVSTLWKCSGDSAIINPDNARFEVTFAVAVWGPDEGTSGAPADCLVLGQDPDYLLTDPSANDQPNVPGWLTDTNCRKN
jgi:hypothetical protein